MRSLHFTLMLGAEGQGDWRHPAAEPARLTDLDWLASIARRAEAACFDAVFCADLNGVAATRSGAALSALEPLTLLSALATRTRKIGLIATLSTSDQEPFNLARRLASLDHISGGRAGWNIAATPGFGAVRPFGIPPHADPASHARAGEFVTVTRKLWDSWSHAAITVAPDGRTVVDGSQTRTIDHVGAQFRIRGPLDVPRPLQGHPVLAGAPGLDRAFVARHAELVFTAQPDIAQGLAFAREMRGLAAAAGRNPQDLRILPALLPMVTASRAEARDLAAELRSRNHPAQRLAALSTLLEADLAGLPPDAPIPPDCLPDGGDGHRAPYVGNNRLSPPQVLDEPAPLHVIGTPDEVAGELTDWFTRGAADGFNVMAPWLPGGLAPFLEEVIPRLQARGIFRRDYVGATLRDHLGLPG